MGGKLWQAAEEKVYWTYIIPRSKKRQGIHRSNEERSWEELAAEMIDIMGPDAPRVYTGLGLCESLHCGCWSHQGIPAAAELLTPSRCDTPARLQTLTFLQSSTSFRTSERTAYLDMPAATSNHTSTRVSVAPFCRVKLHGKLTLGCSFCL